MAPRIAQSGATRKLIAFDKDTLQALALLARERRKDVQALVREAVIDLLKKYGQPVTLRQALRDSARRLAANDEAPRRRVRR